MSEREVEIHEYKGEGYRPIIDFESWRVAILRYCDELLPGQISKMQKHDQTDEVFVLLNGECLLFSGGKEAFPQEITVVPMEKLKIYNVKKGVWHTHTLSQDAEVLIVENQNTSLINSPEADLSNLQREAIVNLARRFWEE